MRTRLNIAVLSTAHVHTKGFLEAIVKGTDGQQGSTPSGTTCRTAVGATPQLERRDLERA